MRNAPQKVTFSIDLFYRGVSTREIQNHLQSFFPHNSSHMTIYRWIVKYAKVISRFTDNLKLKVGKELQIDEMEIGSRKSRYNGWFIDCIDTETRFLVSSAFKKNRSLKEVKYVLAKAKQKTENQFEVITSDGWLAYPQAIQKTFVLKEKSITRRYGVEHNILNISKNDDLFNYKIERLHNSIRHRIKTFRGLHSVKPSNELMKGYVIYYNFIRKHQAIRKCPYEIATNLKLNSENKWLQLIKLAKDFKDDNN